jgi:hypothetical protein
LTVKLYVWESIVKKVSKIVATTVTAIKSVGRILEKLTRLVTVV